VLNDLAIAIQAQDVDACPVTIIRPVLVAVEHYDRPFSEGAAELDALAGVLASRSK
jgi:hypothetical protein